MGHIWPLILIGIALFLEARQVLSKACRTIWTCLGILFVKLTIMFETYIPVIDLVLVIWESIYILSKIVQANLNMKVMLNFLYTATPLSYKEKHT